MAWLAKELNPFSSHDHVLPHGNGIVALVGHSLSLRIGPRVPACVLPASLFFFLPYHTVAAGVNKAMVSGAPVKPSAMPQTVS